MSTRKPSSQYGKKAQRLSTTRRNTNGSRLEPLVDDDMFRPAAKSEGSDSGSTEDVLLLSPTRKNYRVEVFIPSPAKTHSTLPVTPKGKERARVTFSTPEPDRDIPSRKRARTGQIIGAETGEEESALATPNKRAKPSSSSMKPTQSLQSAAKPAVVSSRISPAKPRLIPYVEIISPRRPAVLKTSEPIEGKGTPKSGIPRDLSTAFEQITSPAKSADKVTSNSPASRSGIARRMLKKNDSTPSPSPSPTRDTFSAASQNEGAKPVPHEPFYGLEALLPSTSNVTATKPSGGIAKRMLSRTRTDPEVTLASPSAASSSQPHLSQGVTTPTNQSPQRTISMPVISPSRRPAEPSNSSNIHPSREPSPPIASSSTRPPPRTYTGKSRSFLATEMTDSTDSLLLEGSPHSDSQQDLQPRESYKELRARWGVEEDIDPTDELNNVVHSVIEMRNKGENRKFLDEIGYLFEGLDAKMALPVRRASAVEVITKMADPEFLRKAKVTDIIGRTWDTLKQAGIARSVSRSTPRATSSSAHLSRVSSSSGDVVINACLAIFMALVAQDGRDISMLASKSDFETTVVQFLSTDKSLDPFRIIGDATGLNAEDARKAGVGKAEKKMLVGLCQAIAKSSLMEGDESLLSMGQLVSQTLSSIPRRLIPLIVLPAILTSLATETEVISSRLVARSTGLSLFPASNAAETPNLKHIDYCLNVLESVLSSQLLNEEHMREIDDRRGVLAKGLVELCIFCDIAQTEGTNQVIATRCLNSGIKILITLCENPDWTKEVLGVPFTLTLIMRIALACSTYTSPSDDTVLADSSDPIEPINPKADTGESDHTAKLDQLCYVLALLMVAIQHDGDRAADLMSKTSLSATCKRRRGCVRACQCSDAMGALPCLVSLYVQQVEKSKDVNNEEAHFLRGHLALLLGLLLSRESIRSQLLSSLPGSSDGERVDAVIETIQEFVSFYSDVAKKMKRLAVEDAEGGDSEDKTEEATAAQKNRPGEAVALSRSLGSAGTAAAIDEDSRMTAEVVQRLVELRQSL